MRSVGPQIMLEETGEIMIRFIYPDHVMILKPDFRIHQTTGAPRPETSGAGYWANRFAKPVNLLWMLVVFLD
jgi:hypothetical protein